MKFLTIFFGVSLLICTASFANPCDADIETVCGNSQPGMGTIGDCLDSKKDELSYPCREWLKKMDNSLKQLRSGCSYAAREYCRDIKPGYQRVKNCLMANFDKVPPECQRALQGLEK